MKALLITIACTALAAPAFAQPDERLWNLHIDDDLAQLSWAIPDSDDGGPSFSCSPGDGMVKVSQLVTHRVATDQPTAEGTWVDAKGRPAPWPGELRLTSGQVSETYSALVHPEEMYDGSIVQAEAFPETPIFEAFAESGVIVLTSFGESEAPPPAPRASIRALLNACLPGS